MTIVIKSLFALIQHTEETIASKWGGKTGVFSSHKQFLYWTISNQEGHFCDLGNNWIHSRV